MELPQIWNSALATLAVAAVIIAAWMYLREYRKTEKGRAVMFTVAQLVRAAEQQFAAQGLDGPARRAWVLARAKEYFPDLNAEFLIDLIEAAVYDLNQEQSISLTAEVEDDGYTFSELRFDESGRATVDGVPLEERKWSYEKAEDVEPARAGWGIGETEVQPLKSPALGRLTIEDLHTGNLTTELQIGRLDGVIDPDLGPLSGYGLYVKGGAILHSVVVCLDRDVTLRTWNLADAEESEEL